MAKKKTATEPVEIFHKDGSLWGRGQTLQGIETGYWEWFRKDGTKLRCGNFENGQQVGPWTTYDKQGAVYKVTLVKVKPEKPGSRPDGK